MAKSRTGIQCAVTSDGELLIYGFVGDSWDELDAKTIIQQVEALGEIESLAVRINSGGGFVFEGLAIYNFLRGLGVPINVTIDGLAASMASVIAMAGDSIEMPENALMMVHNPWDVSIGDANQLRKDADTLDKVKDSLVGIYAAKTGLSRDEISELMEAETWFSADEALEAGFIDTITDAVEAAALTKVDVQAFHHIPDSLKQLMTEHRAAASLRSGTQPGSGAARANRKEDSAMTEEEKKAAEAKAAADRKAAEDKAAAEARAAAEEAAKNATRAERKRAADIRAACKTAHLTDEFAEELVNSDIGIDEAREKIIDKWAEQGGPETRSASHVVPGADERDKFRAGASARIQHMMGIAKDDPENIYRGMSLSQLAAATMQASGINTSRMNKSEIASKILNAHTTSDFPYLLADAANKSLQRAYEGFPSTWRTIANRGSVTDFKTVNLIRMGAFNNLATIPEGDQYTEGTIGEEREQLTPSTKGKYIKLTRQMIINDDLSGFSRMASMLGRSAARTVDSDVYAVINANAALSDGVALFHANHSNLAGSGAAISLATLSAGRSAMRKQTAPGSNVTEYLNVMPRYLVVPVVLEDLARDIVLSTVNPDETSSRRRNPIQDWGPLEIVSAPYLDASSTTAWYLLADPMDVPMLEVHFLDGNETPFVDSEEEFLSDAVQWKVRLDYGVAANDYRGGYKNAGA